MILPADFGHIQFQEESGLLQHSLHEIPQPCKSYLLAQEVPSNEMIEGRHQLHDVLFLYEINVRKIEKKNCNKAIPLPLPPTNSL